MIVPWSYNNHNYSLCIWYQILCAIEKLEFTTYLVDNYDNINDNNDNDWNTEAEKHHDNLDPKLLQAAQLFVQDLIERAIFEVGKKLATSERQVCKLI